MYYINRVESLKAEIRLGSSHVDDVMAGNVKQYGD